jgi:3-hydroxy-9,10-secoandrosta-1,3,5(10)-triene-9,17-dione monooxygenase reductase component
MDATSLRPPPLDRTALREALGRFATGVTIVTTVNAAGQSIGLTANSFTSVSLDPPLVLWSLSLRSANLEAFRAAERFAVNVLASDQHALCRRFAQRLECDRFDGVPLAPSATGLPLLAGALATFECAMHSQHEAGDHIVFLGRVLHFDAAAGDALIFSGGRLLSSAQAPQLVA